MLALYPAIDIRHVLPTIQAPTLVLHRRGDRMINIGMGRYLAANIPAATMVELDGDDHLFFTGDTEELLDEIAELLTGSRSTAVPENAGASSRERWCQ